LTVTAPDGTSKSMEVTVTVTHSGSGYHSPSGGNDDDDINPDEGFDDNETNLDDGDDILTAILLVSFDATPSNGEVSLAWETGDETDNFAFNIYRSGSEGYGYVKINTSNIPSKAGFGTGSTYIYTDTDVKNRVTYYYKLETVNIYGESALYGPVSAAPGYFK
jgi:hypothetical protein